MAMNMALVTAPRFYGSNLPYTSESTPEDF